MIRRACEKTKVFSCVLYMALDQLLRLSNSKQNWYLTGTYSTHEHHENRHATLGISMEIVFS